MPSGGGGQQQTSQQAAPNIPNTPFGLGSLGGLPGMSGMGMGSSNFMDMQQRMQQEVTVNTMEEMSQSIYLSICLFSILLQKKRG